MQIKIDYGRHGLMIDVPENADIFTVRDVLACHDEGSAIQKALYEPIQHKPLNTLLKPGMRVLITHSDITRATPNDRLLPVIIRELLKHGIKNDDIILINSLGTHRPQSERELISLLGRDIVENFRCLQHNAYDQSQQIPIDCSHIKSPVKVNRNLVESDLIILTGFIEPHFFTGYSGGPKAVLPALADAESVFYNHRPENIAHPNATFNKTFGNPLWEEMKAAAECIQNTFLVNVTLNRNNHITGVFAGDVIAAHQAGCQFVQETSLFTISEPYDLVITSNSGYPLDQNLYQCVKGMAAAKNAVRKGGGILLLAACEEGLPDQSAYAQLLKDAESLQGLQELISNPEFYGQDTWQVLIQAKVQEHADVYLFSGGFNKEQYQTSLLSPCPDVQTAIPELVKRYGPRVCVLPQGPLTILKSLQ